MRRRFTAPGLPAVLILACCGVLAGCGGDAGAQSQDAAAPEKSRNVRVLKLAASTLEEFVELSGPAAPLRGAVISAEEGGRVETIELEKGSRVRAGQALIGLDRRLLAAERESSAARRDLAAFNEERVKQLLAENAVSEIDYERARAEYRQASAAAEAAAIRYRRAHIASPFDGVVADRYVELGELIAPGTPVARVLDPYVLKLECDVTEQDIAELHEGDAAWVSFAGVRGEMSGRVDWVGFEANPQTGKFPVEIRVDNAELALRPGIMGRARVLRRRHDDVISIPRDAVLAKSGGPAAFVVESGRASLRSLRLGPDQGNMVIVEQGLRPGDRLVVRGQRELGDGMAVAVTEETEASDGSLPGDPRLSGAGGGGR